MAKQELTKDAMILCYTTIRAEKRTKKNDTPYSSLRLYLHTDQIQPLIDALLVAQNGSLTGKALLDIHTSKKEGDYGEFDSTYFFVKEVLPAKGVEPRGEVAPSTFSSVESAAEEIKSNKAGG